MYSTTFLNFLPYEDSLHAALEKMEATDAASITILRKRSQYGPLRNIISGLWFAILYRAVEYHTIYDKDSRCRSIHNLTACLRAGNEISGHNVNISKMVSKRIRSGLASWIAISEEPGLLAIVKFSNPPSREDLHKLQPLFQDDTLRHSTSTYRSIVRRILVFIEKILKRTQDLYRYLDHALREVFAMVGQEDSPENAATSMLSERPRSQYPSAPTTTSFKSLDRPEISWEATFNKITYPRYTVQYDSPIFICVQSGDVQGALALFGKGMASIYDVDPYNLGLLYVSKRRSTICISM